MKRLLLIAALALTLTGAACSPSTIQTPAQGVFAAKTSYAAALTIAVAYKRLPPCAPMARPALCSDPAIVSQLQKVDTASAALLDAAEATVRTPGAGLNAQTAVTAATQAVAAFTTITQALQIK